MLNPQTAEAQSNTLDECSQGKIIQAESATLTRGKSGIEPGVIFDDSGHFEARGADEACDPGKRLGPFSVDSGGTLKIGVTGNPPAPQKWSLFNNGVGVSLVYEPKLGSGFGAPSEFANALLGVGQTEAEVNGEWPGEGRIWANISPAKGSGPLTGSCFEQSYTAKAEITSVTNVTPVLAGQIIRPGDLIETGANGRVLVQGSTQEIGPNSRVLYPAANIAPAVDESAPATDEYVPHPQIDPPKERTNSTNYPVGTNTTTTNGSSSYTEIRKAHEKAMWRSLQNRVRGLDKAGFDVPPIQQLSKIDPGTLDEVLQRLEAQEDECTAVQEMNLFLKTRKGYLDLLMEGMGDRVGEIAWIWIWPNNWTKAEWASHYSLDYVFDTISQDMAGFSEYFGAVGTAMNIRDTWNTLYENSISSYETAKRNREVMNYFQRIIRERNDSEGTKWTESEVRTQIGKNVTEVNRLLEKFGSIPATLRAKINQKVTELKPTFEQINNSGEFQIKTTEDFLKSELLKLQSDFKILFKEESGKLQQGLDIELENLTQERDRKIRNAGNDREAILLANAEFERLSKEAGGRVAGARKKIYDDYFAKKKSLQNDSEKRIDYLKNISEIGKSFLKLQIDQFVEAQNQYLIERFESINETISRLNAYNNVLINNIMPIASGKCKKESPDLGDPCPARSVVLDSGTIRSLTPVPSDDAKEAIKTPDASGQSDPDSSKPAAATKASPRIIVNAKWGNFNFINTQTDYAVTVGTNDGKVEVFEGVVTVESLDGQVTQVDSGKQMILPDGKISPILADDIEPFLINGVLADKFPLDSDVPAPPGETVLVLDNGEPVDGWVWQDPGSDAKLAAGSEDGAFVVSVPDGNEMWGTRGDAPRLIRKVSGDFDLEATLNLQLTGGGNHFAISEFVLFAPGAQLGTLSRQANGANAPGADYRLFGGGWSRFDGISRLPVLDVTALEAFEPADDAEVKFRFSRRGNWFYGQWSLDGERWTLGARERIDAPHTLWTGLLFKRVAHDRAHDAVARTLLRNVKLTSAPTGTMDMETFLPIQAFGSILPIPDGWQFEHDGKKRNDLVLIASEPLRGDFDAVLRIDLANSKPEDGQGAFVNLEAIGQSTKDRVYAGMTTHHTHVGRYQTDQGVGGDYRRYTWVDTKDEAGWVRLVRKDGEIVSYYWRLGRWIELKRFDRLQKEEMFLSVRSTNGWEASQPMAFAPEIVLERVVTGEAVGTDYTPKGYELVKRAAPPELPLRDGVKAALFELPFPVQSPFFDANGTVYLLPANKEESLLVKISKDGQAGIALESEAFGGLNRKRGLWHDGELLVTVDLWWDGGNQLGGLYRIDDVGNAVQVPLDRGLGGLTCLRESPTGSVILCDMEQDGIWLVDRDLGEPTKRLDRDLACPQDAAFAGRDRQIFVVNNGQTYSCDGNPGVFRLDELGNAEKIYVPAEDEEPGGLVSVTVDGALPRGLYLTEPKRGRLVRLDPDRGSLENVLENLSNPGDLAATPDSTAVAILLDQTKLLVLRSLLGPGPATEEEPSIKQAVDAPDNTVLPGSDNAKAPDRPHVSLVTSQPGREQQFALRTLTDPARFVVFRGDEVVLAAMDDGDRRQDNAFHIVAGLNGTGISFEAAEMPMHFLRNLNGELRLEATDGSASFSDDATFIEVDGLAGSGISFHLAGRPHHFLRHQDTKLLVDPLEENEQFRVEASFIGLGLLEPEGEDLTSDTDSDPNETIIGEADSAGTENPAPPQTTQPADLNEQMEMVFWQSIAMSRDIADFQAYLARWPDGTFAPLARNRLAELEDSLATVKEEEPPELDKGAELERLVQEMENHFFGRGTPVDYARSFEIASQCAPMRHPKCMFRLGRLLETGRGTNPDSVAATQWYEKAAEAGERYAMFNLANFYFTGNAVARDLDRAYDLYLRAYGLDLTEAGYGMAMVLMDKNYAGERDPALAAEFMAVAIENGFDTARKTMIENGQSWARDFRLALQRRLKSSGYYKGAIDGDFGPATKTAINRAFGSSS